MVNIIIMRLRSPSGLYRGGKRKVLGTDGSRAGCDTGWRKNECRRSLNGHTWRSREGIERIHGGWDMGDRNDEVENIVDTAMAFDLAIVIPFSKKK